MSELSESDKERIRNGELACVVVSLEYFREGDYTAWQEQTEETAAMTYEEYVEYLVTEINEKYESIVVYSDGCIYGNKGGISHDISYDDFNDVETFIELAEKYGIQDVEFH